RAATLPGQRPRLSRDAPDAVAVILASREASIDIYIIRRRAGGAEAGLEGLSTVLAAPRRGTRGGGHRLFHAFDDKPRDAVFDHLRHRATPEGNHRGTARHGFDHH